MELNRIILKPLLLCLQEAQKKETERLTEINKTLVKCKTEESLKDEFLKLSEQDKKIFGKLVTELKLKLTVKQ